MAEQGATLSLREKLINFGFVCLQIAYPSIYDMLLQEPDFKGWDGRTVRLFRLPAIDATLQENIEELEEFDEQWEQVLYRASRNNSYLAARSLSISRLLNLTSSLIPEDKPFEAEVERILGLAAVTTVSSADVKAQKQTSRVRLATIEEFIAMQKQQDVNEQVLALWDVIISKLNSIFADKIRYEIAPGGVAVMVVNNKSKERRLLKLDGRTNSIAVRAGSFGTYSVRTTEPGQKYSIAEGLFDNLKEQFNKISTDRV